MTTLPRSATAPELALLRADNQSTRLYLTVHSPATVYTARLDAVPSSTDKVAEITYNTGSGTLANVLQDMTMLVGSSAGASDYGIARIRKDGTTTAGTFYIGETSEINWQANAYLTVLDTFELWPRHVTIASNGTTPLMDYDVAYSNQNVAAGAVPTPIMGPPAVLWLTGASVTYHPDGSSSWVKDGTIVDYAWTATGASGVLDLDTATPTIEYNAVGTYRISLTVTGNNAVTFTGYRYVFVVTETSGVTTQFTLDNCAGDVQSGGWSFGVTLYDEATQVLIRDRALCILHAVDYYGNTLGGVGYCAGNENIVALGWISGESITRGTEDKWGSVSFDVQGPHYWLGQMTAFPSGVKDIPDAQTVNKWTKFKGLTLNKALYHFMRWRCTATRCMDVYPNTDTRRHKRLEAPGGQNIWDQLVEICQRSMLVNPLCDRYGRIFLELEHQLVSDRSGMPTVQAITTADWHGEIRMGRRVVDEAALIDLSGISWDGVTATPFFSLAPGHVFNHYGAVEVVDRLMLTATQADTNTLCGLYSAWKNNEYPTIDVSLASNHRLFDITPYQRFTLAQAAADTPRGLVEALTIIPRSISYQFNNGVMLTDATFEAEVTADIAVTGDTPAAPPDPPIVPVDPPPVLPPVDPPPTISAIEIWFSCNKILWTGDYDGTNQPTWTVVDTPTAANTSPSDGGVPAFRVARITTDGTNLFAFHYNQFGRSVVYKTTTHKGTVSWAIVIDSASPVGVGGGYVTSDISSMDVIGNTLLITAYTNYPGVLEMVGISSDYGATFSWKPKETYHTPSTQVKSLGGTPFYSELALYDYTNTEVGATTFFQSIYSGAKYATYKNYSLGGTYDVLAAYSPSLGDAADRVQNFYTISSFYQRTPEASSGQAVVAYLYCSYAAASGQRPTVWIYDRDSHLWRGGTDAYSVPYATLVNTSWPIGVIRDSEYLGGGQLIHGRGTIVANNITISASNDNGASFISIDGNIWTDSLGISGPINALDLVFGDV
jgi:hypothetical protein